MRKDGLSKIKDMDATSGSLYAKYNTVRMVNPYKCHFIATYRDGKKVKGTNLYDTGWAELKDGIASLHYKLSTGQVINIPKFQAYMHLERCFGHEHCPHSGSSDKGHGCKWNRDGF